MHFRFKGSAAQALGILGPAKLINDVNWLRIDAHFIPRGTFVTGFATVVVNSSITKRFIILPTLGAPNFPNAIIATNLEALLPHLKSP